MNLSCLKNTNGLGNKKHLLYLWEYSIQLYLLQSAIKGVKSTSLLNCILFFITLNFPFAVSYSYLSNNTKLITNKFLYTLPFISNGSHKLLTVFIVIPLLSFLIHYFQNPASTGNVVDRISRRLPAAGTQLTTQPTEVTLLKVNDERKLVYNRPRTVVSSNMCTAQCAYQYFDIGH